ncbi:MAG: SpoIIE family protein phosphatase [Candidatus Aminicenantes bacterium]|nr:SpoIIE family protein phosphatase [Candidatus Aminicenantes bacterium]
MRRRSSSQKEQLEDLKKALRLGKQFTLLLAVFSSDAQRDELIEKINRTFKNNAILEISQNRFTDFNEFENHIAALSKEFSSIHVVNKGERLYADTWPDFFKGLNYHREKIAGETQVAIILWMLPEDIKDFAVKAADMWAWRSGVFNFDQPQQRFDTMTAARDKSKKENVEDKKQPRIDEIIKYLEDNPDLEDDLKASLFHELGELYYTLHDYKKSQEYVLKSLAIYREKGDIKKEKSLYSLLNSIARSTAEKVEIPGKLKKINGLPHKILLVDDEPDVELLVRHTFRNKLLTKEWEFIFARNGLEALEKLKENPDVEVILLDINMPGMGGLTFLEKFNEMGNPAAQVIVISGFGDMKNFRRAMNLGAFDFVTKPIEFNDLEITIDKAIKQVEITKQALIEHDKLVTLQSELEQASFIQRAMLPQSLTFNRHEKFDIYAEMIPAKEPGGDFYDFFYTLKHKLAFVIGDVTGKGIPAALEMVKALTLLRTIAKGIYDPGELLGHLNEEWGFESENNDSRFCTLFYGIFDIDTGILEFSSAGHSPPYIIRNNGEVETMTIIGGWPIGISQNSEYEVGKIQLNKGDMIFAFTDGLVESRNQAGKEFGGERLAAYLGKRNTLALKEIIDGLMTEIRAFAQGMPQEDDITMLALRYR